MDKLSVNFGVEILTLVEGYVSTEVDARLSFDTEATLERAHNIIALYEAAGETRERGRKSGGDDGFRRESCDCGGTAGGLRRGCVLVFCCLCSCELLFSYNDGIESRTLLWGLQVVDTEDMSTLLFRSPYARALRPRHSCSGTIIELSPFLSGALRFDALAPAVLVRMPSKSYQLLVVFNELHRHGVRINRRRQVSHSHQDRQYVGGHQGLRDPSEGGHLLQPDPALRPASGAESGTTGALVVVTATCARAFFRTRR